jgi:S-formylglutathione hydrolase FrmB
MESGIDLTYHEEAGQHDWEFWDKYIQKALDWLPLEDSSSGINSGHARG